MNGLQEMIVELPPAGYDQAREGVEYPSFQKYSYFSTTAGRTTRVNVLLPRDYTEDRDYPVLYILHGYWDNEDWMARDTVGLSRILTNLQLDGLAREMIVVAPYIFCSPEMAWCTGMDLRNSLAYDNFINDLTTDLMPFINSRFSVAEGRENTAITGFSMGGRESLFIGLRHPELFGWIGAACPAPGLTPIPGSPMHPGQLTAEEMRFPEDCKPLALLISSSRADGVVGGSPDSYRAAFTANGEAFLTHVMASTGHDHTSVKPHLYNFLRLIFRPGEDISPYPDNAYQMPPFAYLRNDSPARGRVERFEYEVTDHLNGTGAPSRKYALVYLPQGYDPADESARYNVLYLMHGGGDAPEWYLGGEGRSSSITHLLDSMIAAGELEPLIVCAVSYYTEYSRDAGRNCLNFWRELREDLMPVFETAYHTWAEDVTDEGFTASRRHRAFGGFSMGAVATWSTFGHCLDRFACFLPISGDCWELGMTAGGSRPDDTAAALARQVEESGWGPEDFVIYSGCGSNDIAEPNLTPQITAMARLTDTFALCDNFARGNLYECVFRGGGHDVRTVGHILYNGLPKMFR